MIALPKEINYVEYYFSLKCNLSCKYCINQYTGVIRKRPELSVKKAIEGLNRIDYGSLPLTIGGGEPTFRPEFYDLMQGIRADIQIDLLTNLQFDVDAFINNLSPDRFTSSKDGAYKSIRVSYHSANMRAAELIEKARKLQDAGFSVGIFGINHPESLTNNMAMSELARKKEIYFFIKDFLGDFDTHLFGYYRYKDSLSKIQKNCRCRSKELLIGPDGNIYKCHRDLYNYEFPIANIIDQNFIIEYKFQDCTMYGFCNPCDVKIKTNRWLQMGNCSVEIKDVK